MKRLLLALFLLIASMPSAFAAISCTVATTAVAFGVYDPTSGIDKTSNGSVTVTCLIVVGLSGSVAYNVHIAPGNGSYAARALKSGALTLNYNLYTDAGLSQVWGEVSLRFAARGRRRCAGQSAPPARWKLTSLAPATCGRSWRSWRGTPAGRWPSCRTRLRRARQMAGFRIAAWRRSISRI